MQNQAVLRHRVFERPWAAGVVLALWFAGCALVVFSKDVWEVLLFGAPFTLVVVVAVLTPVHVPSSALFTSDMSAGWTWFIRPYAAAWLLLLPFTAVEYAGAGISYLSNPRRGLSGVLNDPDQGAWWWPLFASGMGLVAAFLVVLCVLMPVRVAIDAVRLRSSNPVESRQLTAYVAFWVGLALTIAAHAAAFLSVDEESNRFQELLHHAFLLIGRAPQGVSTWWVLPAWVGLAALATAGVLHWTEPHSALKKVRSLRW